MIKIRLSMLILLFVFSGCATMGRRESLIFLPDGRVVRTLVQHDATLEYKDDTMYFKLNNQGKPGPIDSIVALLTLGMVKVTESTAK